MSEAVTALNGAEMRGYVTVREAPLTGMISLRVYLKDKATGPAVKKVTGAALPKQRKITAGKSGMTVAWM